MKQKVETKYGIGGLLDDTVAEHDVFAKKVTNKKFDDYFIKYAISGPDCPHLLNPWGVHFRQGVDNLRTESILGKKRFEFKRVNKEVFEMYKAYLETRNERYYRAAERALD